MSKYNKVTLVVENDDEKVTIDIPTAIDIEMRHEAVQTFSLVGNQTRFQPDIMDITFHMRAFFNEQDGYLFRQLTESKRNDEAGS